MENNREYNNYELAIWKGLEDEIEIDKLTIDEVYAMHKVMKVAFDLQMQDSRQLLEDLADM